MPRSLKGHFQSGLEAHDLAQCPSAGRRTQDGTYVTGQTQRRLQLGVDIRILIGRNDKSGYLEAFLSGMRWESIPETFRGKCAADIKCFRRELRNGGYSIE